MSLNLDAPEIDASSSIGTSSLTLLNPETLDVRSSLCSSRGVLTVKFAPLPQIDPNRRRFLAPLGVSRRKRALEQEAGSLLWCTDVDVQGESMEDPIMSFARFVKKKSKTLWQRVRRGGKMVVLEEYDGPVLDIRSLEVREYRASWSPSDRRMSLSLDEAKRRSTGDLPH